MNRRTLLAAALVLSCTPVAAQMSGADARDLARISNYLNATETMVGTFVQVDPDAVISQGDFFMRRPGRLRFDYEDPNPALVIADGVWVGVIDERDGATDRYPLSSTPLRLLLSEDVDLRRAGAVTNIDRSQGQLAVTVIDTDDPDQGQITLIFSDTPLELRQWVVTDAQGRQTTVALRDTRVNVSISAERFSIEAAEARRN